MKLHIFLVLGSLSLVSAPASSSESDFSESSSRIYDVDASVPFTAKMGTPFDRKYTTGFDHSYTTPFDAAGKSRSIQRIIDSEVKEDSIFFEDKTDDSENQ